MLLQDEHYAAAACPVDCALVVEHGGGLTVARECTGAENSPVAPTTICLDQAPEVLLSRKISSSSDVWSFGCLIIEAFSRGKVGGAGQNLTTGRLLLPLRWESRDNVLSS